MGGLTRALLGFSLLVGVRNDASARGSQVELRELFDRARAAYDAGRLDQAHRLFQAVRALADDRSAPHYWLGKIEAEQGRCPAASQSFRRYLGLRHLSLEWDKDQAKLDANALDALATLDKCEGQGRIEVTSQPDGASVSVEGETQSSGGVGLVPFHRRLPAHRYVLLIQRAGYRPLHQTIDVKMGETARFSFTLEALSGDRPDVAPSIDGARSIDVNVSAVAITPRSSNNPIALMPRLAGPRLTEKPVLAPPEAKPKRSQGWPWLIGGAVVIVVVGTGLGVAFGLPNDAPIPSDATLRVDF